MNRDTLVNASNTLLAVAACLAAAGGTPIDIIAAARYLRHAAQRLAADEMLSVIANDWHTAAHGAAPAVELPDALVPWCPVHDAALKTARETLLELTRTKPWSPGAFLSTALTEIDDLRTLLNACSDAKSAVGMHVLTARVVRSLPAAVAA